MRARGWEFEGGETGTETLTAAETAKYSTAVRLSVRRTMVRVGGSVDVHGLLYRRRAAGESASSAVIGSGTDVLRPSNTSRGLLFTRSASASAGGECRMRFLVK